MTDAKTSKIVHAKTMADVKKYIENKEPVILWFGADSCKPCKKIEPTVEELAAKGTITVVKLDISGDEFDAMLPDGWSIPFFELWNAGEKSQTVKATETHRLPELFASK